MASRSESSTPGSRSHHHRNLPLVTTLLDTSSYPAAGLIPLHHQRWEIEIAYLELGSGPSGEGDCSGDDSNYRMEVYAGESETVTAWCAFPQPAPGTHVIRYRNLIVVSATVP